MKRKEGKALQSVIPRTFREITTDISSRRFDSLATCPTRADRFLKIHFDRVLKTYVRLDQFLETGFLDLDPVDAWRKVRQGVFVSFLSGCWRITG
jgi:hypothetical protein